MKSLRPVFKPAAQVVRIVCGSRQNYVFDKVSENGPAWHTPHFTLEIPSSQISTSTFSKATENPELAFSSNSKSIKIPFDGRDGATLSTRLSTAIRTAISIGVKHGSVRARR